MSERMARGARIAAAAAILCWAMVLPVMAAALLAETGGPDQEMYNKGRSLIFDEKWTEARAVFETLAKRYPQSTFLDSALYWTAFSLFEDDQPGPAYATLRTLVGRYPGSPWNDDARALMVRCAESALNQERSPNGQRLARAGSSDEYRRFLEESTRDRSAQVSLLAIDSLITENPKKAPDLLGRVGSTGSPLEGSIVLLDRFFGKDLVRVTFDEMAAGFSEGNVHVLVRDTDQAIRLTLQQALDVVGGRSNRRFSDPVRREMRAKILEAERTLVTQGAAQPDRAANPSRRRTATIVRVVDGEVHYYSNGAETVRIVVLRRSAGFSPENIQIFVERGNDIRRIELNDATAADPGATAKGLSADTLLYLTQSLGVIQLDLTQAR